MCCKVTSGKYQNDWFFWKNDWRTHSVSRKPKKIEMSAIHHWKAHLVPNINAHIIYNKYVTLFKIFGKIDKMTLFCRKTAQVNMVRTTWAGVPLSNFKSIVIIYTFHHRNLIMSVGQRTSIVQISHRWL